jgi:ribonuclease T2
MPRTLVGSAARLLFAAGIAGAAILGAGCSDGGTATPPSAATAAAAPPQGTGFDFWVLSLSWSPSYCAIEGEDANRQQCGRTRKLGFVVHGLWPQYDSGWPEFCNSDEPERVPDGLVRDYLDIIPSAGLIGHQWRKHGTCSGLDQRDYLATARSARERVTIPEAFAAPDQDISINPGDVEAAFIAANPGLEANGIAITCDDGFIEEARICMTKALEFQSCAEVDARACKAMDAVMPEP